MKSIQRTCRVRMLTLYAICLLLYTTRLSAQTDFKYHDAKDFLMVGRGFQDSTVYHRLPYRYKQSVRPELWELSRNSAGIAIRFATNSSTIAAKWKTGNVPHGPHVAKTLIKGVDLYGLHNGKWQFVGVGRPYNEHSQQWVLVKGMEKTMKEFMLYLPMYETVDSVLIGVSPDAVISKPVEAKFRNTKPIVFYGTSIVQGASAMRPGMAYPSIISRHLNIETINLGFSGNGVLEKELARAITDIDASCYVIDCGPNLNPKMAAERTAPFIKLLKEIRPQTPVLVVENIIYPNGKFNGRIKTDIDSVNLAFRNAYATLKKEGIKGIYYLPADGLIGEDGEATVDGTHLTDLGFLRIAEKIGSRLKEILKLQ